MGKPNTALRYSHEHFTALIFLTCHRYRTAAPAACARTPDLERTPAQLPCGERETGSASLPEDHDGCSASRRLPGSALGQGFATLGKTHS